MAQPGEPKVAQDDFHRARSRFLDAYAKLEEALQNQGQMAREEQLEELLKGLAAVRNDLVHSRLRFAQIDGELQALVVNTDKASGVARPARVVRIADFKVLGSRLANATRQVATKP